LIIVSLVRRAEKRNAFNQAAILHQDCPPQLLNDLNFVISDTCATFP